MKENSNYNNPLIFSKNDIYGDSLNIDKSTDIDDNEDVPLIDVFDYENMTVEYNFKTGSSSLYLQKNENEYELLYYTTIKNNTEISQFYNKDSVYLLKYNHNTGNIYSLDYWKKKDLITFLEKFDTEPNNQFKKLTSSFSYIPFMVTHSKRIIEDNKRFYKEPKAKLFNDYKKLFIKYSASAQLIPASYILELIIGDIHNYIATKKLEKDVFKKRLSDLQSLKDVCPSSTSALNSFLENPAQTNLHQICDLLEKNLKNIDTLINIYLEEELDIQKEGEKYDSK